MALLQINNDENTVPFEDIKIGDIFLYRDCVNMKIMMTDETRASVNLLNGEVDTFWEDFDEVTPLNCSVKISNRTPY